MIFFSERFWPHNNFLKSNLHKIVTSPCKKKCPWRTQRNTLYCLRISLQKSSYYFENTASIVYKPTNVIVAWCYCCNVYVTDDSRGVTTIQILPLQMSWVGLTNVFALMLLFKCIRGRWLSCTKIHIYLCKILSLFNQR